MKTTLSLFFIAISSFMFSQTLTDVYQVGGLTYDHVRQIERDTSGNIYCAGIFTGTVDFDITDEGVFNQSSFSSQADVFVAKYNKDYELEWVGTFGGTDYDYLSDLAIKDSALYFSGYYASTAFNNFTGGSSSVISSNGGQEGFVIQLDLNGNFNWIASIGSTSNDKVNALNVDNNSNVIVSGEYAGTIDCDQSTGTFNLTAEGGNDSFIIMYDSEGEFVDAISLSGTAYENIYDTQIDDDGNILATGFFSESIKFHPDDVNTYNSGGEFDIFIVKYDGELNLLWAQTIGAVGYQQGDNIETDSQGNIYVAGRFTNTVDFDPSTSETSFSSSGFYDAFVVKFNSNGDFMDALAITGSLVIEGDVIQIDDENNIYIAGIMDGDADFNQEGTSFTLSTNGDYDAYLAKYNQNFEFEYAYNFGDSESDAIVDMLLDDTTLYLVGYFQETVNFDVVNDFFLTSNGSTDGFIAEYNLGELSNKFSYNLDLNVDLYPNPASDVVYLLLPETKSHYHATIYNIYGQKMICKNINCNNSYINIESLPFGLYLLELSNNNNKIIKKFNKI